jgi:hypothetical protein
VNFLGHIYIPPVNVSTASLKETANVFRIGYRVSTQNMVNNNVLIIINTISARLLLIAFLFFFILIPSLLV